MITYYIVHNTMKVRRCQELFDIRGNYVRCLRTLGRDTEADQVEAGEQIGVRSLLVQRYEHPCAVYRPPRGFSPVTVSKVQVP
jgi:hypothetical protein